MSTRDQTALNSECLDDVPRQTLVKLIADYGQSLCDEPRRCEGLLRDFCGTYRREIHVLLAALKERVVADLLSSQGPMPQEVTFGRLVKRLKDNRGLTEAVAVWAVDSWALALKVISADQLTAGPSPNLTDGNSSVIPEECQETTPSSMQQTVVPPARNPDVMTRRRYDGLVTKGRRLLEAVRSGEGIENRLKRTEEAVTVFSEALELTPGDADAHQGLDDALTDVLTLSSQCGEKAYRDRQLARAAEYFQRALEIDPGHAASEARLKVIASEREAWLDKARTGLDAGQPKTSVRVLESAREMFPGDTEVESLLAEAQSKVSLIHASVDDRIPDLERQKKLCELSRLIESLESSGVRIRGLAQYKESLQARLDSIAPALSAASASLARHDYGRALLEADAVLACVADHDEALHIQQQANDRLASTSEIGDAVRLVISTGGWLEAKRLLLSKQIQCDNDLALGQLCSQVDHEVKRIKNHWRLVALSLMGLGFWLMAGKLASMFSGGIHRALVAKSPFGSLDVAIIELAGGQTAQLSLAAVMVLFWAAVLAGRQVLRSVGPLVVIVIGEAVVCGILVWINRDGQITQSFRINGLDALVLALVYGSAAGILLAVLTKRLLPQSDAVGYITAMVSGVLAAAAMSIVGMLPDALLPEILAAELLLAIVLCGLLLVLGLIRQRYHFVLVPVAVVMAYGLELGADRADAGFWQPFLPWVGTVFITGAVLLLSAHGSRSSQMFTIVFVAVVATFSVELVTGLESVPAVGVLLGVWFAVSGSLAIVHRQHLLPNWQLAQWLRLCSATRAADSSVASSETFSHSDS